MHVFFDDQTFVSQEQGGISRYFCQLALELAQCSVEVRVFGGMTRNRNLDLVRSSPGVQVRMLARRDRWRINTWISQVSRFWRRWDFVRWRRTRTDLIYHATGYRVDPWIAARADRTCLTVFDMIGELFDDEPRRLRSLEQKRYGVELADGILCISQCTQRDFIRFFPGAAKKTAVTLLASSLPRPSTQALAAAGEYAPYLLLVGNRSGYKNGQAAIEAFARLAPMHKALRLVCFGGESLSETEEDILQAAGARHRVQVIQGDDERLAAYYSRASALIYPSRYEGFGLPVLEAMQCDCPVITTACASLPEVAGMGAVTVDPGDVPALVQGIDRLLRDEVWRQGWIRAGREQSQRFSWRKTAQATLAVYKKLLAGKA